MENIFEVTELPIQIKKGSTLVIPITWKDKDGNLIDLTDYQAKLQVRRTPNADDPADITLTEQDGIDLGGVNGTIAVTFSPDVTLALDDGYSGKWDLFLIPSESAALCILTGDFIVLDSTTKV